MSSNRQLVALAFAGLISTGYAQFAGPTMNTSWHRSIPAGPYGSVSTALGGLDLNVTLFSIEGPGDTNLTCSLSHRSNMDPGSQWGMAAGDPGKGWKWGMVGMATGAGQQIIMGGSAIASWDMTVSENALTGVSTATYVRQVGVRGSMSSTAPLYDTYNRTCTYRPDPGNTKYVFNEATYGSNTKYISYIEDAYGNQVTYTYRHTTGSPWGLQLTQVTDAVGRFYTVTWSSQQATGVPIAVTLNCGGQTRVWDLTYTGSSEPDGSPAGYLKHVVYPAPLTGSARPQIQFQYQGYTVGGTNYQGGSVTDCWDLKGNRWHYTYDTENYGGYPGSLVVVRKIHRPTISGADGFWSNTYYTELDWTAGSSERICTISEPFGTPYPGTTSPGRSETRHVYTILPSNVYASNILNDPIKRIYNPVLAGATPTVYEEMTWDISQGNVTQRRDAMGKFWNYGYLGGNSGLLTSQTTPLGNVSLYWYEQYKVIHEKSDENRRKSYFYNTQGDLIKQVVDPQSETRYSIGYSNPSGKALTSEFNYQTSGSAKGEINASSLYGPSSTPLQTTFDLPDSYGRFTRTTMPNGMIISSAFDAFNNKTSSTTPALFTGTWITTFSYDRWNRLVQTTFPDSTTNNQEYDANGNITSTTDANGNTTLATFNRLNFKTSSSERVDLNGSAIPIYRTTNYEPDIALNQYKVIEPLGQVTEYIYDFADRLEWIRRPDNTGQRFTFDNLSRPIQTYDISKPSTTWINQHWTEHEYDDDGRVVETTDQAGNIVTFGYDGDGVRLSADDWSGAPHTWAYNSAGQMTSNYQPGPNKTLTYAYDAYGRRTTLQAGSDFRLRQTFDANSRPVMTYTKEGSAAERAFLTKSYYGNGLLSGHNFEDEGVTSWSLSYDNNSRVTAVGVGGYVGGYHSITYQLDNNGNPIGYYDENGNSFYISMSDVTYDRANRIISEEYLSTDSLYWKAVYGYDKNDNRVSVTRTTTFGGSPTVYNYTYASIGGQPTNRLLSGDGYQFASSQYDYCGNPKQIVYPGGITANITYWQQKRLPTAWSFSNGRTLSSSYDFDGRRYRKQDSSSGTAYYLYDGETIIAELDNSKNFRTFYIPGEGEIDKATGARKWYSYDRQGSLMDSIAEGGYVAESMYHDSFGNVLYQWGTIGPFRYNGRSGYFHDNDVDMDLLQARYYIPLIGRFMQADPIGQDGGLNTYAYCHNNPFIYSDPSGEDAVDDASNFFAGWGDTLTFGATWHLRESMGVNSAVDGSSPAYTAGFWTGVTHGFAFGGSGGGRAIAGRGSYLKAGVQGVGAHAFERHVGKTMISQIVRSLSLRGGAASSFKNVRTAEESVAQALRANSRALEKWLSTAKAGARRPFEIDMGRTIGYGARKGVPRYGLTKVRVILKANGKGGAGIHTAFPF